MKKQLLLVLIAILGLNCYAQISYEKGYYINNSGQKIEGLIKNIEWLNNPTSIQFKSSENSDVQNLSIESVKEFRVYNYHKYERHTVDMDRSSDYLKDLSSDRNVNFKSETLFLKIEVDGDATLYSYFEGNLKRFFFKTSNTDITQLVYKRYYVSDDQVGKNNLYQQQLWKNLKCSDISLRKTERLDYKVNKLTAFFNLYNQCKNPDFIVKKTKVKANFNISIRPGVIFSTAEAARSAFLSPIRYEGGNGIGYRFGAEMEFVMKFNRNKWALLAEPTYQSFKADNIRRNRQVNITPGTEAIDLEYSSLQLPVGIRHYMFLGDNSSIFLNALMSFRLSSEIYTIKRPSTGNVLSIEKKGLTTFNFGIGYKYGKYSVELRYAPEESIQDIGSYDVQNNMMSLIIGYKIF